VHTRLTNQSQCFQTQVSLSALRSKHFHPVLPPSACSSSAVPKSAFVVVFAHYSLTLCCWPIPAPCEGGWGCLRRTQPQCYRILEHARLSRGKTITLKCLRPRFKPFIAPMTMHSPPVIMRMYCEAFVVRALRAERKKTGSRELTLCTPG
jgi:hypothetical protein